MDEFERFYNKVLRFLSYRLRSEKEVRDYLKKKEAEPPVVEKIIEKLKEYKFLNDEEFAKLWTKRKKALRIIQLELRQKGIDRDLIEKTINTLQLTVDNDLERAKSLVEKKVERFKDLPRQEIYKKLGSFLARRGFDWDTIKEAIDEFLQKGV